MLAIEDKVMVWEKIFELVGLGADKQINSSVQVNEFASNDKEENEGNESDALDLEKKSEAPITAD